MKGWGNLNSSYITRFPNTISHSLVNTFTDVQRPKGHTSNLSGASTRVQHRNQKETVENASFIVFPAKAVNNINIIRV